MNKCEQFKNIIAKHQLDIIDGFESLIWDIWNDLDDLIIDIKENDISKTDICDKLIQICDNLCEQEADKD